MGDRVKPPHRGPKLLWGGGCIGDEGGTFFFLYDPCSEINVCFWCISLVSFPCSLEIPCIGLHEFIKCPLLFCFLIAVSNRQMRNASAWEKMS